MWSFSPACVHGLKWKIKKWISSTLFVSGAQCYTDISCIWTRFFTVPPLPADVDLAGGTGVELGATRPWWADCLGRGVDKGIGGNLINVVRRGAVQVPWWRGQWVPEKTCQKWPDAAGVGVTSGCLQKKLMTRSLMELNASYSVGHAGSRFPRIWACWAPE